MERLKADGDTVTKVRLSDSTHAKLSPNRMESFLDALVANAQSRGRHAKPPPRKRYRGFESLPPLQKSQESCVETRSVSAGKETTLNQQKPGPRADKADGESAVLAAIAAMPAPYRAMGERLHAIIKASALVLSPKTWYGMPAYAKDGKVVCFFRGGEKFKERYMTLGFNHEANLDEGHLWPIAYALTELTAAEEAKIGALVRKAVR